MIDSYLTLKQLEESLPEGSVYRRNVRFERNAFNWAIQANSSHWYTLTDGDPRDNTWDEVWVSAKFTGPAYVKGSTRPNAIWVDMVVATRKPKN